jgi:MFS superfamily sulfate permease-like transporter
MKSAGITVGAVPPQAFSGLRRTLAQARLDRHEIAGSLGDMGTFLPLLVGMAAQNGLDFAAALFFAGLFNLVTGLTFAIPMAVQPMKAIAAVALTEGLAPAQIVAAGATVSLVILVLGLTGLIEWLNRAVPKCVVRGLQLALGLSLLMKALQMVAGTRTWVGADSYLTGVLGTLLVVWLFFSRRVPAALVLFAAGLVLAVWKQPEVLAGLGVGLSLPQWTPPAWSDYLTSFGRAALPQIPLTTLNSVIAVCALSVDLFPDRPAAPRRVAVSVGLMNLVGVWFGAMPMCHGAGGLAGQHRFGARTNGSILFLGGVKMLVAVLFGASLMALCQAFPASVLGVMLAFSGLELALVTRDQTRRSEALPMLLTAGVCLGLNNIALGFALGLGLTWCLKAARFPAEDQP